ncbi:MAG: ribosome silencing factor [Chloroflexi bacterium]|nr:ribosome silencing factor [Chloroflexota bacterium]
MESTDLAKLVVEMASDKLASDIVMLDLQTVSLIADYFVICSAGSERQIAAVRDDILKTVRNLDPKRRMRVEGDSSCGWVLMDLGDVVVHIFGTDERDFYALDRFWSDARPVVQVQ